MKIRFEFKGSVQKSQIKSSIEATSKHSFLQPSPYSPGRLQGQTQVLMTKAIYDYWLFMSILEPKVLNTMLFVGVDKPTITVVVSKQKIPVAY
jgi:hypothetical protein